MDPDPQIAVEYYVLKSGDIFGPFPRQDIVEGLDSGRFAPDDFVQIEGQTTWAPLGSAVGEKEEVPGEAAPASETGQTRWAPPASAVGEKEAGAVALAPSWETILKVGWLRLRNHAEERSFGAGAVCLGMGTACMIFANWPFVFWIPWFVGAAAAAAMLVRGKRGKHGALLLLAALGVPLAVCVLPLKISWHHGKPLSNPPPVTVRESRAPAAPPAPPMRPEKAADGNIPGLDLDPRPPGAGAVPQAPGSGAASPPEEAISAPVRITAHYAKEPVATPGARFAAAAPAPSAPAAPEVSAPSNSGKSSWWSVLFGSGRDSAPSGDAGSAPDASDLESAYASSLVLAKGDDGSGSGFICKSGTGSLLYTNIHVVADIKGLTFTRNDGVVVSPSRGELVDGRDVARFDVTPVPARPLEMITNFDQNVRIGDAVAVLGNSGGGGVVTALRGVIDGIGPDRIEVSAQFIPGNSGSPIIHVKTGKVIGIATYVQMRAADPKKAMSASIRRFGYRIDNAPAWQGINWPMFQRDAANVKKISMVTDDLFRFIRAFPNSPFEEIQTETLRRDFSDWKTALRDSKVRAERISATERFLREFRFVASADVASAEQQLTYTFFRDELGKQKKLRARITSAIDNASNVIPSSLTSGHL